jgi:hypothetical protein
LFETSADPQPCFKVTSYSEVKKTQNTVEVMVFLIFLLVDGKMQIRIRTNLRRSGTEGPKAYGSESGITVELKIPIDCH